MTADFGPKPITPLPLEPPPGPGRERRRRRRERNNDKDSERVAAQTRKGRIHRWVGIVVALGIAGIAIVPITLWSRHSTTYVTSRNAAVKGSITHVGSQISGVLASVEVEAGQQVEVGQVLARFDDHQLQARLSRATSRLTEAMAHSASARTRIDAAETQRIEAQFRHDQRVPLAAAGAISRDEMRNAETRLWTAEAMLRTAVAEHQASAAEISTAQAEVALARADLAVSVIRAPAAGRVVRRISEPGASVIPGQPILDILIGEEVWVEAWIDQADLSKIAVGNDAKVTVSSQPGRAFPGKVASIGVSTDFELPETAVPQSRKERMRTSPVVPVRVRLEEREGLLPGLSAVVAIQRADIKRAETKSAEATKRADTR